MTNDIAVEADVLRCGYDIGYLNISSIVQWADRHIVASDAPADALLDLSMSREMNPIDVNNLLQSLGHCDPATTIETQIGFIGLLFQSQRLNLQSAIRGLYSLVHEPGITDAQETMIYHLDAGFDLAVAGTYGTLDDIERELRDFIAHYADKLRVQYPHLVPTGE